MFFLHICIERGRREEGGREEEEEGKEGKEREREGERDEEREGGNIAVFSYCLMIIPQPKSCKSSRRTQCSKWHLSISPVAPLILTYKTRGEGQILGTSSYKSWYMM